MAVFCPSCATRLPASARFCSKCGAAVPPAAATPRKPLIRPRAGRVIAGVCIGMAQTYDWDVALVRILTVVGLCVSGGLVAVAYLAGWIGIPEELISLP